MSVEHDYRCVRGCGVPEIDAARAAYERNWPGRCWYQAPDEHRRLYLEVEAIRVVEAARQRAREAGA